MSYTFNCLSSHRVMNFLKNLFSSPRVRDPALASMASKFVADTIASNKVVVFSKTYCPYCTKAKRALQQFTTKFTVVELDGRPDCDDVQDALLQATGGRSVPRVFIDGAFIGGGDDTAAKAANGELQALLQKAGVL